MAAHPHVCTSCGRECGACADAAAAGRPLPHPIREPWCTWCASVYMENAPAADGRVYCQHPSCEHDLPFPGLAALIEQGQARYPKYCRACRERERAEAAEFRALDAAVGVEAVVRNADPRPPRKRLQPEPDTKGERERNWARGGFRPRPPGPDTHTSELGDGDTEWPGITHSSY